VVEELVPRATPAQCAKAEALAQEWLAAHAAPTAPERERSAASQTPLYYMELR